jgi:SHAQKYF class myb-like DNA-binding protein
MSLLEKNSVFNLGRWLPEEHQRFIQAMFLYGNEWRRVQEYIGTRSSTQARSHAQKFFIRLKKRFSTESYPDLNTIKKKSEKILNWIRDYIPLEVAAKATDDSHRKFLKVIMNLMSPMDFKNLSRQSELELSLDLKSSDNQILCNNAEQQTSNLIHNNYTFTDSSNDKFYLQDSPSCQDYNSYYAIKDQDYIKNLILDLNPNKPREDAKIRIPIEKSSELQKSKRDKTIFKITKDFRRKKKINKKLVNYNKEKMLICSALSNVSMDTYKKEEFCDFEEFFKFTTNKTSQIESENKEKLKSQNCKDSILNNNNSVVNTQYFNPNHQNYINIVNINFDKGNSLDGNTINSLNNLMANSFNQNNHDHFEDMSVNNNYTNKINLNYISGNRSNVSTKENMTKNSSCNSLNTNLFSNFNNLSKTNIPNNNINNAGSNSYFNNQVNNSNNNNGGNQTINNNNLFNSLLLNNIPNPLNFFTNLSNSGDSENNPVNNIEKLNAMTRVIKLYQFMLQSNIKNTQNSILNNISPSISLENTSKNISPLIEHQNKFYLNESVLQNFEEKNTLDNKTLKMNIPQQNIENIKKIITPDPDFIYQKIAATTNSSGIPVQSSLLSNTGILNYNSNDKKELSPKNVKNVNCNKDTYSFDGLFGIGPKETGFDGLEEENFCKNFFESQQIKPQIQENKDFNLDEYFI